MVCVWGKEPCFRPVFRWLSFTKKCVVWGLVCSKPAEKYRSKLLNLFFHHYLQRNLRQNYIQNS